jgi:hypothetical protein
MYDPISIGVISPPGWISMQKHFVETQGTKRDPTGQQKFQDYIEVAKKKELNSSASARRWEEGRKKEWKKNKPYYLKNGGKF